MAYPAMWTDVVDLRDFYASPLGQMAQRLIMPRLRSLWPDVRGMRVLGLGFAIPYLRPFLGEAERVIAMMPANQGILAWPPEGPNLTCLVEETLLPLPDRSMDRILLVHAVESTEQTRALLREIWRVLGDSGRLMLVVPNRSGIWAGLERTPFGNGRPFTPFQLQRLLRENLFAPLDKTQALMMPPFQSPALLRLAPAIEKACPVFPTFAGVNIVEASKQLYAATGLRDARPARKYLTLPQGLAQ